MSLESVPAENEYHIAALLLGGSFLQRRDMYPKQLDDGSYVAIHEPLTESLLVAHLQGEITLGAYVLDQDSRGRYMVFDADNPPDWRQIKALSIVLAQKGCSSYLEASRRGGHLWLFMHENTPGKDILIFGTGLIGHFGIKGIEMFPKQAQLTTGPGSLIRLPFGVHRKTGCRYSFYTTDHKPLACSIREQLKIICNPKSVSLKLFDEFHAYGEKMLEVEQIPSPIPWDESVVSVKKEGVMLSDRIKATIPIRQFVLSYVELSPRGMGRCPFHDDQVESFSVSDEGNYWHCFGCATGGSIIDFYMRFNDCDFITAVRDLARELL